MSKNLNNTPLKLNDTFNLGCTEKNCLTVNFKTSVVFIKFGRSYLQKFSRNASNIKY